MTCDSICAYYLITYFLNFDIHYERQKITSKY